jgi:hypothetical protein
MSQCLAIYDEHISIVSLKNNRIAQIVTFKLSHGEVLNFKGFWISHV